MEDTLNSVSYWLDQNDKKLPKSRPRQPFADLSVNNCSLQGQATPIKSRVNLENTKGTRKPNRKRSNFKSTRSIIDSLPGSTDSFGWTAKKLKKEFVQYDEGNKNETEECNIVANDELIVIEESQNQIVDKDHQAWQAVVDAEKNDPYYSSPSIRLECSEVVKYTDDIERITKESIASPTNNHIALKKVPFFKKSSLIETCNLCNNVDNNKTAKKSAGQTDDVKITIESSSFTTTIKVITVKDRPKVLQKQSTSVQTEIEGIAELHEVQLDVENNYKKELDKLVIHSQDLFTVTKNPEDDTHLKNVKHTEEKANQENTTFVKNANVTKQIIIADSDSDDTHESNVIQVTAEVHRSSDEM